MSRAGPAVLDPQRHLDQQPRRRPFVGVHVERDVEAVSARVVDKGEQRLRSAGVRLAMIEVRDVNRPGAAPADVDRLAERIEVAITERVADMRVVEAAVARRFRRQRRELVGRGIRAGRVVEAARESERAGRHRVREQCAHIGERPIVRGDVVPAETRDAQRAVADD